MLTISNFIPWPSLASKSRHRTALRAAHHFRLADAARDNRKWTLAASHYEMGLAHCEDRSEYWVQFGHALKESGQLSRAENAYMRAAKLRPDDADVDVQLGHLYQKMTKQRHAQEAYQRAAAKGSTDRHAITFLENAPHIPDPRPVVELLWRMLPAECKTKHDPPTKETEYESLARLILRYL
jgi:tetratricopeptide (TPR) repeat protein